jgi:hypothetical protein
MGNAKYQIYHASAEISDVLIWNCIMVKCIGMDSSGSRINAIVDSFVSKKKQKKKIVHEAAVCFKNIVFIISYHTIHKQIN